MKNKTFEEIIKSLTWQIEDCKKLDSMTDSSWGYEEGVIMSGNDAVKLIELYTRIKSLVNDLKSYSNVKNRAGNGGEFQCCINVINSIIEKLSDTIKDK